MHNDFVFRVGMDKDDTKVINILYCQLFLTNSSVYSHVKGSRAEQESKYVGMKTRNI